MNAKRWTQASSNVYPTASGCSKSWCGFPLVIVQYSDPEKLLILQCKYSPGWVLGTTAKYPDLGPAVVSNFQVGGAGTCQSSISHLWHWRTHGRTHACMDIRAAMQTHTHVHHITWATNWWPCLTDAPVLAAVPAPVLVGYHWDNLQSVNVCCFRQWEKTVLSSVSVLTQEYTFIATSVFLVMCL